MSEGRELELLFGSELYEKVIQGAVLGAERTVWIATANLKDMHVPSRGRYVPILRIFNSLARSGVRFRIIHSDVPSGPFRETLEGLPELFEGSLELQVCPRSHWKMVIVDGRTAYFGSANFTGAGLGAKKREKRNLEIGAVTTNPDLLARLEELFDRFWIGEYCADCAFRGSCPDPIAESPD